MVDLILKGGRIYDGSGLPSFIGDVAIKNGLWWDPLASSSNEHGVTTVVTL